MNLDYAKAAADERREAAKWEAAEKDPKYAGNAKLLLEFSKRAEAHRTLAARFEAKK